MSNGYLIPDNPQPEDLRCLILWIPHDPDGFYLRAMAGAFTDMGKWNNWDRDGTSRGSLAASTWKDAIDYTFANGWEKCMDLQDQINDILNQLKELNEMQINVNCGCGCNCGGCNGSANTPYLDPTTLPENPIVPDEPESQEGDVIRSLGDMCAVATQYADGVLEVMQKMKTFFGGVAVSIASVEAFIASILRIQGFRLVLAPTLFLFLIQSVIAVILSAELTENAFDAAQQYRDAIKCAIYGATSPTSAKSRYLALVNQIKEDWGFAVSSLFWFIGQITDWRKVVTDGEGEILAEYAGSTCIDCGAVGNLPNNVTGYEWRVATVTATNSDEYTTSLQLLGNGYRYTALIDDPPTSEWRETQESFYPVISGGEEIVAHAWRVLEASAPGASDPSNAIYNWEQIVDDLHWHMDVSDVGTIREDLEESAPFDSISEVVAATFFTGTSRPNVRTSCAITPGFPGPVPIVLDCRGFAYCVMLE